MRLFRETFFEQVGDVVRDGLWKKELTFENVGEYVYFILFLFK
jgi:hypothetical protein